MPGIKGVHVLHGCGNISDETQRDGARLILAGMHVNNTDKDVHGCVISSKNKDASNGDGWENSCENRDLPMARSWKSIVRTLTVGLHGLIFDFEFSRWRLPRFDTGSLPPRNDLLCFLYPPSLSLFFSRRKTGIHRSKGVTSVRVLVSDAER